MVILIRKQQIHNQDVVLIKVIWIQKFEKKNGKIILKPYSIVISNGLICSCIAGAGRESYQRYQDTIRTIRDHPSSRNQPMFQPFCNSIPIGFFDIEIETNLRDGETPMTIFTTDRDTCVLSRQFWYESKKRLNAKNPMNYCTSYTLHSKLF